MVANYANIALEVAGKRVIFGSWLYTCRKKIRRGNAGYEYYVLLDSFDPMRTSLINAALEILYTSNRSDITKAADVIQMESLIDWFNVTNSKVPKSVDEAKRIYREYTNYLLQIVKRENPNTKNGFGHESANRKQKVALDLLGEMVGATQEKISGMIAKIPERSSHSKDFDLNEQEIDKTLNYCFQFFEQVAEFCLQSKKYPYKIALLVPEAIADNPVITPFTGLQKNIKGRYWDFERCDLKTEAEIEASLQECSYSFECTRRQQISRALHILEQKKVKIKVVNTDPNHIYRLELAAKAMKAYFFVLLDITGMNDSMLATLSWSGDDFIEDVAEKGMRNIKRRAGNREVIFKIQSIFMGSFRTFIKLRRFILNGHDCSTLFFTGIGENSKLSPHAAAGCYGAICYDTLKRLYPHLLYIGSQTLRINKKRWLMKKSKGQTFLVAAIMQHKPETGEQNYPHETRQESQSMIGEYLIYQHRVIMDIQDYKQTSVGGCDSLEAQPNVDINEGPIKPDCQKKMTCLFCTHYRLKTESEEIRKVISLEYVINRHSILHARSQIQFESIMGPVLQRIKLVFESMIKKYPYTDEIIKTVRNDVYENQNLHWYWQVRLELLWELGWV